MREVMREFVIEAGIDKRGRKVVRLVLDGKETVMDTKAAAELALRLNEAVAATEHMKGATQ